MNMKLILNLVLMSLTTGGAWAQVQPYVRYQDYPYAFEMKNFTKTGNEAGKGVGEEYDLKYHRFNWYVDPDTCYIEGSVTSYFVPQTAPFSHVRFELSSLLNVDSVIYEGAPKAFQHMNDLLDIDLGQVLPVGTLDSLIVYYHGAPGAGTGFGSFIRDTHNTVPVIWTLSEPYGTKDWWPCKNILSDKIDSIDIFVRTPSAYRAASNGVLVSEISAGADKIYHWKHRYPIAAYLVAIAVTNYSVYSDEVPLGTDTLEMLNYVFPENLVDFQTGTAAQVEVLQLFDSLFGPYPYLTEKYGHAQFKWGGGMEHQTMSFVVNAGFDLLAHEMAHQWYGDKVTCGSWQDIWVNEGFATYCQGLTLDFMFNGYWFPFWLRDRIQSITSLPDGSVFCYDTSQVSRVFDWRLSYQKGAMVLHMLRWKLGDTAFFEGMKNIIADPQLAYGYAKTEDIQHQFELAGAVNLDEFFQDWIFREGHPVYTINCTLMPDSTVQVSISQAPSHASVSFFELPVPLRFKNQSRDSILVFDHTFSGQVFTASPGFMADSVFFDPEMKLLALLDTLIVSLGIEESPVSGLKLSPNPAGDWLQLSSDQELYGELIIADMSGRICIKNQLLGNKYLNINISELSQGTYIIKIPYPGNIISSRFVKN